MTIKNSIPRSGRSLGLASLFSLFLVAALAGCGGGGGDSTTPPPPPPPPSAKTFQASLQTVVVIDRSDGSSVQVNGGSVSGATVTLP